MSSDTRDLPELSCQWCGGTIPAGAAACVDCGAIRPREDLVVPGLTRKGDSHHLVFEEPEPDPDDDAARARQILMDMDAYIPETQAPAPAARRDPGDDVIVVITVLVAGAVVGGLLGWLLLPPLLHELFRNVIGVESDGPEAFRRLGAFVGGLLTMLFGALLATVIRR